MTNIFLLLILCSSLIQCVEIEKEIYYEIPSKSVSHCVRRLNNTSSIGCSSKSNGNVGIIELAFNETDLNNRLASLKEDTILVINTDLFVNPNITDRLLENSFITGLIIFEREDCNGSFCEKTAPQFFSEDYKSPNKHNQFNNDTIYNPPGTEYAFKNWPFPIALIGKRYKNEQDKILECYYRFNFASLSNRRCALEIRNFMAAIKDAQTCLRYEEIQNRLGGLFHLVDFCVDFTGMNYAIHSRQEVLSRPSNSVIALIARTDSLSMFESSAVNVHGSLTSTAMLLSVMALLTAQPEFQTGSNLKKDVLFLLIDNESYDYLGSNRLLIDMANGNIANMSGTPINLSHLALLLEFGELSFSNFQRASFHYPRFSDETYRNRTLHYLVRLAESYQQFGFQSNHSVDRLPPSSVQYMLQQRPIPSIVMTDHDAPMRNPFYNSFLDSKRMGNNSQELLAIVNAVASFVFQEATGKNLTEPMQPSHLATPSSIIECFSENIRCDLLKEVFTQKTIDNLHSLGVPIPAQAHSSNKEVSSDYRFSYLLHSLVVRLSGRSVNNSVCDACKKCLNLTSLSSGNDTEHCFVTRIEVADKFSILKQNGSFWVTSTIVDQQSVRMFVKAPNKPLLITGIIITVSMAFFMMLTSSRMGDIFQSDS